MKSIIFVFRILNSSQSTGVSRSMTTTYKILIGLYLTLVAGSFQPARAVIVFEDPGRLTTMPLVNGTKPGWQFIGTYGSFTGIPIGPRSWVTAEHVTGHSIGSAGVLNYDNAGNSASANYSSTLAAISGDLAVMTLDSNQPSFTSWALSGPIQTLYQKELPFIFMAEELSGGRHDGWLAMGEWSKQPELWHKSGGWICSGSSEQRLCCHDFQSAKLDKSFAKHRRHFIFWRFGRRCFCF